MAEGHAHAARYPIGKLWTETAIVAERINQKIVTEAIVWQSAYVGAKSKKGGKAFQELVEKLNGKSR